MFCFVWRFHCRISLFSSGSLFNEVNSRRWAVVALNVFHYRCIRERKKRNIRGNILFCFLFFLRWKGVLTVIERQANRHTRARIHKCIYIPNDRTPLLIRLIYHRLLVFGRSYQHDIQWLVIYRSNALIKCWKVNRLECVVVVAVESFILAFCYCLCDDDATTSTRCHTHKPIVPMD